MLNSILNIFNTYFWQLHKLSNTYCGPIIKDNILYLASCSVAFLAIKFDNFILDLFYGKVNYSEMRVKRNIKFTNWYNKHVWHQHLLLCISRKSKNNERKEIVRMSSLFSQDHWKSSSWDTVRVLTSTKYNYS